MDSFKNDELSLNIYYTKDIFAREMMVTEGKNHENKKD